jgi:hypothetical protein
MASFAFHYEDAPLLIGRGFHSGILGSNLAFATIISPLPFDYRLKSRLSST